MRRLAVGVSGFLLALPLPGAPPTPLPIPSLPPTGAAATAQPEVPTCAWFLPLNDSGANALYLDQNVYYWATRIPYAPGESLTVRGQYPHSRYFSLTAYDPRTKGIASLYDVQIAPDDGSSNPFLPGADRALASRGYTVSVTFNTTSSPNPPAPRRNELQTGFNDRQPLASGADFFLVYRVYLADRDTGPAGGVPLPQVSIDEAGAEVPLQSCGPGYTPPGDVNDEIADANSPAPIPVAPGQNPPYWHRFYNFGTSAAQITFSGASSYTEKTGTGGFLEDLENAYLFTVLNANFGPLFVIDSRALTYPSTFEGERIMQGGKDARYWSFCSYDTYSQRNYACLADHQAAGPAAGRYLVVVSNSASKPADLCGAHWLPFGPANESLLIYRNQLGVSPYSVQQVDPSADNAPSVMGDYYPGGTFMTQDQFNARYCASSAALPGTGGATETAGNTIAPANASPSGGMPALAQTGLKLLAALIGLLLVAAGILLYRRRYRKAPPSSS